MDEVFKKQTAHAAHELSQISPPLSPWFHDVRLSCGQLCPQNSSRSSDAMSHGGASKNDTQAKTMREHLLDVKLSVREPVVGGNFRFIFSSDKCSTTGCRATLVHQFNGTPLHFLLEQLWYTTMKLRRADSTSVIDEGFLHVTLTWFSLDLRPFKKYGDVLTSGLSSMKATEG